MPLIRLIDIEDSKARKRNKKDVNLSKTEKMDLHHGRIQMKTLTNKWYEEVRQGPSGSEDDEQELLQQTEGGAQGVYHQTLESEFKY